LEISINENYSAIGGDPYVIWADIMENFRVLLLYATKIMCLRPTNKFSGLKKPGPLITIFCEETINTKSGGFICLKYIKAS